MIATTEQCPACGATLRDNVPFCVACGLPRPTAAAAPAAPAPSAEAASAPTPIAEAAPAPAPVVEETAPMAAMATPEPVRAPTPTPAAPAFTPQAAAPHVAAPEQNYNSAIGPIIVILAVALIVVLYLLARSGAIF